MSGQAHRNAGTFFLHGSRDTGVLLVHGYSGAPAEMRMLGNFLQEKGGYTVLGVCLAGHCTTVEALEQTTWPDWYEAVEDGVKALHSHCRHIYIAGQSMGGLLAIKAAAEFSPTDSSEELYINGHREDPAENRAKTCSVEKLILLATPVFLQDWRIPAGLAYTFCKTVALFHSASSYRATQLQCAGRIYAGLLGNADETGAKPVGTDQAL